MNPRINRINEEISKEICNILRTVKDPRVSSAFISITNVDTTPDLKYSKIYYSTIGEKDEYLDKGLKSACGYIRGQLAHRLNLRITPELKFIADESMDKGAHITQLINTISAEINKADDKTE